MILDNCSTWSTAVPVYDIALIFLATGIIVVCFSISPLCVHAQHYQ